MSGCPRYSKMYSCFRATLFCLPKLSSAFHYHTSVKVFVSLFPRKFLKEIQESENVAPFLFLHAEHTPSEHWSEGPQTIFVWKGFIVWRRENPTLLFRSLQSRYFLAILFFVGCSGWIRPRVLFPLPVHRALFVEENLSICSNMSTPPNQTFMIRKPSGRGGRKRGFSRFTLFIIVKVRALRTHLTRVVALHSYFIDSESGTHGFHNEIHPKTCSNGSDMYLMIHFELVGKKKK